MMKAVLIVIAALGFSWWMYQKDEDPQIGINAAAAVCFALAFLFICLLVIQYAEMLCK